MKAICACIAALALVALPGGCGSDGDSADEPVRIGASLPLSGPAALTRETSGLELPFDDVNAAGGLVIDGERRRVELVVRDNRSSTSTQARQLRELVLEDEVSALIGAGGGLAIPAAGVANSLEVPMILTGLPVELFAGATEGKSRYAWDTFTGFPRETFQVADLARTNKRVVAIGGNDPNGPPFLDLMRGEGAKRGYEIVASTLVPVGTTDFSRVIREATADDAEVLVAALGPAEGIALWKQMKALGYAPVLATCYLCAASPAWAELGELGEGAVTLAAWTKTAHLPGTVRLLEHYGADATAAELNIYVVGFHLGRVLLDAIDRADSADPEAINEAIARTNGDFPLGHVEFAGDHTSRQTIYYVQWRDDDVVQVFPPKGAEPLVAPVPGLR